MELLRRVACLALALVLAACATSAAPVAVASPTAATAAPTATPTPAPTVAPTATPIPPPDWTALPIAAADPVALAAQLVMAEGFIRDPKVTGDQLAWAGHMEQLVLGTLSDYPDWTDQV